MKLFLDTCVSGLALNFLKSAGHDVIWSAEWESDPGDDEILLRAQQEERILVTIDKDFGELVYRLRRISAGVLLMRLAGLSPAGKAELVSSVIREHGEELMHTFTVIAPGMVRIRPRVI